MELHPLVEFLLGQDRNKKSWLNIAKQFNINPEANNRVRAESARSIWSSFIKKIKRQGLDLETVKQTFKNRELVYETRKKSPQLTPIIDSDSLEIVSLTTSPTGGAWTRYQKKSGFSNEQIKALSDQFDFTPFKVKKEKTNNKIGVVDISDIHAGAVVKMFYETVKQKEFNSDILINYMDNAANVINNYNFSEVHVFLPGDLIESFTGFNHPDTYKNIEKHQGEVVILSYQIIKRFLSNITNLTKVYMVEGNHDRVTQIKATNSRKGIVELVAYFLGENSNLDITYHPFLVSAEIDNIHHICTHGDFRPFDKKQSGYDTFFFKYGKQGMYNVLRTGHYHRFNILAQTQEYLHYECPSIFTGSLFEETLGYNTLPAITILQNFNDLCNIDYRPLTNYGN